MNAPNCQREHTHHDTSVERVWRVRNDCKVICIHCDVRACVHLSIHVQSRIAELREAFAGRKILLGVDRLDYIKGMPHKLLGLELFFTRYPEWHGKVWRLFESLAIISFECMHTVMCIVIIVLFCMSSVLHGL